MEPIKIKLVVVGDGAVGKTSLLYTYVQNKFPTEYQPTVFDSQTTTIKIDNHLINLTLWDTAGQEEYATLRPLAYTNADIFLITFSAENRESMLNAIKKWYPEVKRATPDAALSFICNKIDLRNSIGTSTISTHEAKTEVGHLKAIFCECSALTRQGVKQAFERSIKEVLKLRGLFFEQKVGNEDEFCPGCQMI